MTIRPNVRSTLLVAALAAVGATAWATDDTLSSSSSIPSNSALDQPSVAATNDAVAPGSSVAVNDSLAPNEGVIPAESPATPVVDRNVEAQPPVTVEQRRLSNDERIQSQVMDRIAGARNISGKIGVESYNAVVTLTGYTTTTAQADRASRYAGGVMGVKYVQNEIRSRMGGSI
ncbi:MAG TPA: BON domain-containing protein [Usitatibacter sp.]|nr:BON domain-containing protein [Usitatibacter sp.]